jgi:hypothetical protein
MATSKVVSRSKYNPRPKKLGDEKEKTSSGNPESGISFHRADAQLQYATCYQPSDFYRIESDWIAAPVISTFDRYVGAQFEICVAPEKPVGGARGGFVQLRVSICNGHLAMWYIIGGPDFGIVQSWR